MCRCHDLRHENKNRMYGKKNRMYDFFKPEKTILIISRNSGKKTKEGERKYRNLEI